MERTTRELQTHSSIPSETNSTPKNIWGKPQALFAFDENDHMTKHTVCVQDHIICDSLCVVALTRGCVIYSLTGSEH